MKKKRRRRWSREPLHPCSAAGATAPVALPSSAPPPAPPAGPPWPRDRSEKEMELMNAEREREREVCTANEKPLLCSALPLLLFLCFALLCPVGFDSETRKRRARACADKTRYDGPRAVIRPIISFPSPPPIQRYTSRFFHFTKTERRQETNKNR